MLNNIYRIALKAARRNDTQMLETCLAGHVLCVNDIGVGEEFNSLSEEEKVAWGNITLWVCRVMYLLQDDMPISDHLNFSREAFCYKYGITLKEEELHSFNYYLDKIAKEYVKEMVKKQHIGITWAALNHHKVIPLHTFDDLS
jgi:hypothetical protein